MKNRVSDYLKRFLERIKQLKLSPAGKGGDQHWKPLISYKRVGGLLALVLAACAPRESATDKRPTERHDLNASYLAAKVETKPLPNQYRVVLTWGMDPAPTAWTIHRADDGATPLHQATLEGKESYYQDERIEAGRSYRYVLGALQSDNYQVARKIDVIIPKDLEVTGFQPIWGNIRYERLFLNSTSQIATWGRDLVIDVNELVTDGGSITSFPEGQTAPPNVGGRSGGKILIRARTARGVLHIFARGENGGVGLPGSAGADAPKGARGNDGQCDIGYTRSVIPNWFRNLLLIPEAYAERDFNDRPHRFTYCKIETGNGAPGPWGARGGPGSNGRRGGDSTQVLVEIDDPSLIQVKPHITVGLGGAGGSGGPGGSGGMGGDPGNQNCDQCRVALPGLRGATGQTGPVGTDGPAGTEQSLCLKLGKARFGSCDSFQ